MAKESPQARFTRLIIRYARTRRSRLIASAVIFLLLVGPVIALGVTGYLETGGRLTAAIRDRRQALAELSAATIKERLDRLIDVNVALSSRPELRDAVEAGRWDAALDTVREALELFPYVERIVLAEPGGDLLADTLPDSNVLGQNFAHRDWYQGVTREWKPYVSEVYRRQGEPVRNVVAVASPIRAASDDRVIGILNMQITLDTFFDWSREIEVGPNGFVYFVDQRGHLVSHPRIDTRSAIVDFTTVPAVRNILSGSNGMEIAYNPVEREERLSAYRPVAGYGWGAVVTQPIADVFASRDAELKALVLRNAIYVALMSLTALASLALLRSVVARALREQAYLDGIGDGVIVTDAQGRLLTMNPAAERLFGLQAAQVRGLDIVSHGPVAYDKDGILVPSERRAFRRALALGQPVRAFYWYERPDGTRFAAAVTAAPAMLGDELLGAVNVVRDITEEKELEREKSEFIFIASHQLRTPLTAVKWFIEMLLAGDAGELSADQKEFMKQVFESNERMIVLVNDLLNVSRIESSTIAVVPEPTDFEALLKDAAEEIRPLALQKSQALKLETSPLMLKIDGKLVRQVVMNLLSNAIKYTPANGEVRLRLETRGTEAVVSVSDTGMGVPKDDHRLLFKKFFRAANALKSDVEGTGLGLYVCKSIVELSGGRLWFESREGAGSTFSFSLPLAGSPPKTGARTLS